MIVAPLASPGTARNAFLRSLYPREDIVPSEWAETYRVLSKDESSEPGPYSFDRTPYWRFPLDLAAKPMVEEIICLKGAQIGWSELCRNMLGFWIDLSPGPTLILAADQKSCEDFRDERIEPLIQNTPAVKQHSTQRAWDTTKHRIKFDAMSVFFTWAGSKSGTKSRPIRYLICEEPDEYPAYSSTGGDPLAKALKRITTYSDKGLARVLIGGTPTVRAGNIWKRWEMCPVRYHFWLPCPACNGYQLLQWKQVTWPKDTEDLGRSKHANKVEAEGLAYYECEHCKAQIRDHQKPRMLRRGVWATEDQAVTLDGRVVGPTTTAKRVGVKISSLYSPWVHFGTLAKEWIESNGDSQARCDFINQRLAEPYEEQRAKIESSIIAEKATGAPKPLIVPKWARLLIATADTQGTDEKSGYFWYVIRAWGYGYRSQLVDFGVCHSKEELRERCLVRPIPLEAGGSAAPQFLLIDTGGPRWQEIYQFCQSDPARIKPTKGASKGRTWIVEEKPQKRHDIILWIIDTEQSKDLLHLLINDPDRTRWLPFEGVTEDYCKQMSSEAKVFNPTTRQEEWVEIVMNNNHAWDCEHQQCAAAWRMGCGTPEPVSAPSSQPEPQEQSAGWNLKTW